MSVPTEQQWSEHILPICQAVLIRTGFEPKPMKLTDECSVNGNTGQLYHYKSVFEELHLVNLRVNVSCKSKCCREEQRFESVQ